MGFCGVNGVGKSTNLAKICFWLIENNFKVLIAACDTFRAGAVEQLRTHTRRLNSLHPETDGKPMVQLYEKGYGKDAAGIAMEAINHARDTNIDVVLVDTAGRMQDNEPLMRSLAKLISVNGPDLVLFVGEALVGNEAIDQVVKFNAALADHSSQENPHTIDGIVLTKFDTIDDKVGSSISMTYIPGQPIVFVGTGQTYTDLKSLNAKAVVTALMKWIQRKLGTCCLQSRFFQAKIPDQSSALLFCSKKIELITNSTTSSSFSSSSCGKAFIGKIPDVCCRNIFIAGSKRHFAHVVIFIPGLCS